MSRPRGSGGAGEAGMSLIELIVAIAISTVILAGIAALFAQGISAQAFAVAQDQANNQAQLLAMNLQTRLRDSCKATISADGTSFTARTLKDGAWATTTWSIADAAAAVDLGASPNNAHVTLSPAGATVTFRGRVTYDLTVTIKDGVSTNAGSTSAAGVIQLQAYSKEASSGCS